MATILRYKNPAWLNTSFHHNRAKGSLCRIGHFSNDIKHYVGPRETLIPYIEVDRANRNLPRLRIFKRPLTWNMADMFCKTMGGKLFEPKKDSELDITTMFEDLKVPEGKIYYFVM